MAPEGACMGTFVVAMVAALLAVAISGLLGFLNYKVQETPGAGWGTFMIVLIPMWLFLIPIVTNLLR